ncbi:hypothetical protein [Streptomyces sp. NPDC047803]|uniref:hypothetical protein n=1 Tax=unclassified Streptomyces TaxID=2593676 RepID=UPI0033DAB7E2
MAVAPEVRAAQRRVFGTIASGRRNADGLALRRGEYGEEIHALLGPVDATLADLVRKGRDRGVFGRHLPARILSQVAYAAVFAIAGQQPVEREPLPRRGDHNEPAHPGSSRSARRGARGRPAVTRGV